MDSKNDVVETYYDNGELKSRANYKDGERNGLSESWYANRQLKLRVNYKDDKLDGLYEYWRENGQLESRTSYKNDKLDGLYESWYANGQPWSRVSYKNGKRDGLRESWYENGQLELRASYKDGVVCYDKQEQNEVEQESDRETSEEKLLRLDRENLAMKIMLLRDKYIVREITFEESLKQSVGLIEEYDKTK